jgi:hypothetical protein
MLTKHLSRRNLIFYSIAALVLFTGSLYSLYCVHRGPKIFSDSSSYLDDSKKDLLSPSFLISKKPITIGFFYKLFGSDPDVIIRGQALISLFSWWILSLSLSDFLKNLALKFIVFLAGFHFALWWAIAGWNYAILSESLCFSFFALWLATLLRFSRNPSWRNLFPLIAVSFFFSSTRDNLPYALLFFSLSWILSLFLVNRRLLTKYKKLFFAFFGAILLIFSFQTLSAARARRPSFGLYNVLFARVFPNEEFLDWFRSRGMPFKEELLKWKNEDCWSYDFALFADKKYENFRTWIGTKGAIAYAYFLFSHPKYALWDSMAINKQNLRRLFSLNEDILREKYIAEVPEGAPWIKIATRFFPFVSFGLCLLLAAIGAGSYFFNKNAAALLPILIFMAFVVVNAVLIFHADAVEIERHASLIPIASEAIGIMSVVVLLSSLKSSKKTPD